MSRRERIALRDALEAWRERWLWRTWRTARVFWKFGLTFERYTAAQRIEMHERHLQVLH